mmetsp:Transcript_9661/g.21997  ORF Transcript_9661/g.21997 Transcript_9661/m.21997 type:complete len:223 (+) Transcript_9661:150-818(+)
MGLRLSCLARHHFWSVDEEEERPRLGRQGLSDHSLAASWGPVEEDTTGRVHPELGEEGRVPQRQFDHLTEDVDLLRESSDVVVSYVSAPRWILLPLERFALSVDDCLGCNDTPFRLFVVNLHHLEVNGHVELLIVHWEDFADMDRAIVLKEVRLEEDFKGIAFKPRDAVLEWQNMNSLRVLDIWELKQLDAVRAAGRDSEVLGGHVRQTCFLLLDRLIGNYH